MNRFWIVSAGLAGAAGVALSAVAAHAGGDDLRTAATFLLLHAPAFLALGLSRSESRTLDLAGGVLLAGLLLFTGDLAMRAFAGVRLFPMAAPAGGLLMIAGWIGVALSGLLRRG